jgi:cytidylate kinase
MSIITVSRGTFSGGKDLAECVAERLGYPCLGREEIISAAADYGVPLEKLSEAMTKPPTFWERLAGERQEYLNFFRAAMYERAAKGDFVYHGYAAHIYLTGISHVLRVRVIADQEYRVNAAMRRLNVGRQEAIAQVEAVDKERSRWVRFILGVDWNDPSLYDVVLNLEQLTFPSACNIVYEMSQLAEFQPTPASLKLLSDRAISNAVWVLLNKDPETEAADVEVTADAGVVTITGTAWTEAAYKAIPEVAARVEGVKEVRSHVRARSSIYYEYG